MDSKNDKETSEHILTVPDGDIDDLIFDEYHTKEFSEK